MSTCEEAVDCARPSPLYDPDNWTCNVGECEWLGCNDDDECRAGFMNANYECRDVEDSEVRQCVATCNAPSDCNRPSPIYDGDNWTCTAGECEWLGCNDDDECRAGFMNANYICGDVDGFDVPQCVAACAEAGDCSRPNPLYDGDNWACERQRCEWLGCNDDNECINGIMNANQACVPPE